MSAFAVFLVMSALSTAFSAYQGHQSSKAQEANQKAISEQERINAEREAQVKENEAEQERLNREAERKEQKSIQKRRRSLMESAYAKSGVLLEGTPSDYLVEQAKTDELNVQRADQRSRAKGLGLTISADALRSESKFQQSMRKSKADAYGKQATGSLISGALKTGSNVAYYSWMGK